MQPHLPLPAAARSSEEVFSKGVLLERLCMPLRGGSEVSACDTLQKTHALQVTSMHRSGGARRHILCMDLQVLLNST